MTKKNPADKWLLGRTLSLNALEKSSSEQKGLKSVKSVGLASFLDMLHAFGEVKGKDRGSRH